jgi:hypothetical protein
LLHLESIPEISMQKKTSKSAYSLKYPLYFKGKVLV